MIRGFFGNKLLIIYIMLNNVNAHPNHPGISVSPKLYVSKLGIWSVKAYNFALHISARAQAVIPDDLVFQ